MSNLTLSDLTWTGPFAHRDDMTEAEDHFLIEDRSQMGVLDLRLHPGDGVEAASRALGLDLPAAPRTSTIAGDLTILWFSIDQWLIAGPRGVLSDTQGRLADALKGHSHALTDVSDMRAVLRLSGGAVRPVLAKSCPIDLWQDDIAPGFVRRVTFGEIAAALHIVAAKPDIVDLYVFRSFADYAVGWLNAAAGENRLPRLFTGQPVPAI